MMLISSRTKGCSGRDTRAAEPRRSAYKVILGPVELRYDIVEAIFSRRC